MVDEGFDVAIRVRVPPLDESDLAMRPFGPSDMILVGSPALLAAYGQPEALTDIARIPTLTTGTLAREQTWILFTVKQDQSSWSTTPVGAPTTFTPCVAQRCKDSV